MKSKLSVPMPGKVTEPVGQHPVLYDQHHQDYRDAAFAANIQKSNAKALKEDVSVMYLQNTECNGQSSFTIMMFCPTPCLPEF